MSSSPHTLRVASRFRGPPTSGNGGYVCGLLAEPLGQPLEVMLRSPPPLERALALVPGEPARLLDGDVLLAQASPTDLAFDVPGEHARPRRSLAKPARSC